MDSRLSIALDDLGPPRLHVEVKWPNSEPAQGQIPATCKANGKKNAYYAEDLHTKEGAHEALKVSGIHEVWHFVTALYQCYRMNEHENSCVKTAEERPRPHYLYKHKGTQ